MLPSEARETYHSFLGWYYDDKSWSGTWSSREEGNIEDYKQAELPLELTVGTTDGKVFGEMFNRRVCDLSPMLPPVLVEGEVSGKTLVAYAYAYVRGQKNLLYTFEVSRVADQPVAIVRPLKDPLGLLPFESRLVQRTDTSKATEPVMNQAPFHPDLQCPESPTQYLLRLRKQGKLSSVEELGFQRRHPASSIAGP